MQVFMPFNSFPASVGCLDKTRLGNQVWREAKTLLTGGWPNHPAAKLWRDYKPALATYCICGLAALKYRGDISPHAHDNLLNFFIQYLEEPMVMPPFMGNEHYHKSHRLNLLWKLPSHYSKYFDEKVPVTKPDYYWPLSQVSGLKVVR